MIIRIDTPRFFSEIGQKDNQEDFLWPQPATVSTDQRIFIMCDGVGGQDSGEVASETSATALGTYLTQHWPADGIMRKEIFDAALAYAYDELDKVDTGAERKMGTTMTCIMIHRGGVMLAHIGDSRIYHLRPSLADTAQGRSGIIYQTEDHSLVNDLLRIGELTPEEAEDFPRKNVITRAMQPNLERRCRADVYNATDLKDGDYFFLCCDGVLERVTNQKLGSIVSNPAFSDDEKIAAIKSICDAGTRDNYTCWLVPIASVEAEESDAVLVEEEIEINAEVSTAEEAASPANGRAAAPIDPASRFTVEGPVSAEEEAYEEAVTPIQRPARAAASQRPAAASMYPPQRPVPAPKAKQSRGISRSAQVSMIVAAFVAIGGAGIFYTRNQSDANLMEQPAPAHSVSPGKQAPRQKTTIRHEYEENTDPGGYDGDFDDGIREKGREALDAAKRKHDKKDGQPAPGAKPKKPGAPASEKTHDAGADKGATDADKSATDAHKGATDDHKGENTSPKSEEKKGPDASKNNGPEPQNTTGESGKGPQKTDQEQKEDVKGTKKV